MPLAIQSYSGATLDDSNSMLSLAWTADEAPFLQPALDRVVAEALAGARRQLAVYLVTDPYGQAALAATASAKFGVDQRAFTLYAGAGVGGLVFALAAGLSDQTVAIIGHCYPDMPAWLGRFGATILQGAQRDAGATFLERPGFLGPSEVEPLDALAALCRRSKGWVIVDESNANYLPDDYSAATLLPDCENLIVLRGLSKGYGMGGLRFGMALCGRTAGDWAASALPPLQNPPLTLAIARAILSLPAATFRPLWARIVGARTEVQRALTNAGLPSGPAVHPALPYFVYDPEANPDHRTAVAALTSHGIVGKRHLLWAGTPKPLRRYSLPLAPPRMARFLRIIATG